MLLQIHRYTEEQIEHRKSLQSKVLSEARRLEEASKHVAQEANQRLASQKHSAHPKVVNANESGEDADHESVSSDSRDDDSDQTETRWNISSIRTPFKHTPADDLESMFYIFYYFITLYDGPCAHRRETYKGNILDSQVWAELPRRYNSLQENIMSKSHLSKNEVLSYDTKEQVTSYFHSFTPILEKLQQALYSVRVSGAAVSHDAFIKLLQDGYNDEAVIAEYVVGD